MSDFRRHIVRRVMLSIWAMATLVLLFCVILLVLEMLRTGTDPMALLRATPESQTAKAAPRTPVVLGSREVPVYFAAPGGGYLLAERRRIDIAPSIVDNCRAALTELIAGPTRLHAPVLPPQTKVRGLYLLEDGELVVDLSGDIQPENPALRSAELEALMVYAVVNTLCQPDLRGEDQDEIKRVRFLIEGSPPQERFPSHIGLTEALAPDARWNREEGDAQGNE